MDSLGGASFHSAPAALSRDSKRRQTTSAQSNAHAHETLRMRPARSIDGEPSSFATEYSHIERVHSDKHS